MTFDGYHFFLLEAVSIIVYFEEMRLERDDMAKYVPHIRCPFVTLESVSETG